MFHLFLVAVAIVVVTGFGTWGLFHQYRFLGVIGLAVGALLVVYEGYFATKAERMHLK